MIGEKRTMRKKRLGTILALSVFLIAGCSQIETSASSDGSAAASDPAILKTSLNNGGKARETSSSSSSPVPLPLDLHLEKIQGDIKNIYYADGNQVFISADKLYLYNLDAGRVTAETPQGTFDQERYQAIKDGYVAVGGKVSTSNSNSSGSFLTTDGGIAYSAIFYDRKLNKKSEFRFNKLLKENEGILSLNAISFSADGNQAAFATNSGLYLYDFKTNKKTTVIDLNSKDGKAHSGVVTFEQIGFTNDEKKIAFKAQSFDIPAVQGKPSFDTCGTVNTDGSGMSNRKFDNYTCKELTTYNKLLLFAEDFTIPSGRVLVMEIPGGKTKIHALTEKGESGFISGSDSGRYFATSLSDKTGWKIRVYNTNTGKLEAEQRISSDGEALYMANDPIVKIVDDMRTYIVLLGSKQAKIKTKVVIKQF